MPVIPRSGKLWSAGKMADNEPGAVSPQAEPRLLSMRMVAAELRVSQQWLKYWLVANPVDEAGLSFYVPIGRRWKFERRDIERILNHMRLLEGARLGMSTKSKVKLAGLLSQLGNVTYESRLKAREEERRQGLTERAGLLGAGVQPPVTSEAILRKLREPRPFRPRHQRPETAEENRARLGYTDENGNVRKIVAGLGAGKVRVIAPDGRRWTEDAKPSDPAPWQRKRKLKLTPPTDT